VHLAKGDVALAAKCVRDALDHPLKIPSKEFPPHTELRRAPLLEAQVEIGVAGGDLELAQAAGDELAGIAARFESKALIAGASLANGRVALAKGDAAAARGHFEQAAHLWNEIGAPYETALARMGLGHAYRAESNEERASLEFNAARSAFERIGAAMHATEAARACGDAGSGAPVAEREAQARLGTRIRIGDENVFRREGEYWSVAFQGQTVRLRDLKGLGYLARLLARPGRDFHVLELVADATGGAVDVGADAQAGLTISLGLDAGVLLDAQAKKAYRRRLAEIDQDCEQALAMGDQAQAEQAQVERDFLVRELARAVGLGGRDRRAASMSERARASVTRAIRHAMAHIHEHHPALGAHLERTIRTGTCCAYLPDPQAPSAWKL
jgi:hypothetical protein